MAMPDSFGRTPARFLFAVLLCACADERTGAIAGPEPEPPAHPSPVQTSASIWGYVVDGSGICLSGVNIEIVSGPGTGRKVAQTVPCNAWDYGNGFAFDGLPTGSAVTLRATKPGYVQRDVEVVTRTAGYADVFELLPK
jgi:hypothetical protein